MATKMITRVRRAAAALVIATPALLGGATPAGAVATASVTDNGNGSITVTYAGIGGSDHVLVFWRDAALTCPSTPGAIIPFLYVLGTDTPQAIPSSPAVLNAGTNVLNNSSPNPTPLPDGNYRVCVYVVDYANQANDALVAQVAATIGNPTPPAPPTTPGNTPQVPPAYTG